MLNVYLNWRNNLSNLPSAATGRRKRSGPAETACLREPMFAVGLLTRFSCSLLQRGFSKRFQTISPGVPVAVVIWPSWEGKSGRGPFQEWCDKRCIPDSPTPNPSPSPGEPHRISPESLGKGPVRFFFFVRERRKRFAKRPRPEVSEDEEEAAVNEAMRSTRPNYRPIV